jgi:flagellar basal-body rod protein FlgC
VASNLANADSATSASGEAYRAKQVVFEAVPLEAGGTAVRVQQVVEDPTPGKQVYDPKHPLADAKGYVTMPNVNVVDEMVNMLSASRSYQTNVETMNAAKTMLLKTLTLGQ